MKGPDVFQGRAEWVHSGQSRVGTLRTEQSGYTQGLGVGLGVGLVSRHQELH